jgi:hypothetical protein
MHPIKQADLLNLFMRVAPCPPHFSVANKFHAAIFILASAQTCSNRTGLR